MNEPEKNHTCFVHVVIVSCICLKIWFNIFEWDFFHGYLHSRLIIMNAAGRYFFALFTFHTYGSMSVYEKKIEGKFLFILSKFEELSK